MIVEINESMDDYFDMTDAITAALRKAFGSAVTDVAKLIEREQPGGGQWLADA